MEEEKFKCLECKEQLYIDELELFGEYYKSADYCDNKKCKRYLVLIKSE